MVKLPENGKSNFLKAFAFGPIMFASDTGGNIKITLAIGNLQVADRIISGEIRGLSPELKIRKWECSICHDDFEKCDHEVGERYSGLECQLIARGITFSGASMLTVPPKDPRCRITDLLLIREENGRKKLEWYGFRVNSELDRFRSIQSAYDSKLIPQEAAFRFGEFFSINLTGNTVYP